MGEAGGGGGGGSEIMSRSSSSMEEEAEKGRKEGRVASKTTPKERLMIGTIT